MEVKLRAQVHTAIKGQKQIKAQVVRLHIS